MYVQVVKSLMWVTLSLFLILRTAQFQVPSYWSSALIIIVWIWVRFENFVYPSCILGHADKDAWSVVSGASSAMDTHSHYDLTILFLTHQRATIVFLLKWQWICIEKQRVIYNVWFFFLYKAGKCINCASHFKSRSHKATSNGQFLNFFKHSMQKRIRSL